MRASSSSCSGNFDYDVFLSFRGEDTRYNFVSHLYEALKNKGIITFKDDKELERGKPITPSLSEAIQNSKIALIVFSPNYVSSPWCLDELVEIIRCKELKHQIVMPIFFKVHPSDIESRKEILTKAFDEHKLNFENNKIRTWRNALSTVATISGWDAKSFGGDEAAFIKCIVQNILGRLFCGGSCFESELIGIKSHMKEILWLLNFECHKVRMVGIWGPGGIGKTTIAEVIFHRYRSKFEACCSLKNIKEKYKREGLIYLQREFISQIFSEEVITWEVESRWDTMHTRLRNKKVLIVLDDVDDLKQLNTFIYKIDWFGEGSRIIITTRDKHLLVSHNVQYIYHVQLLWDHEALQLFSLHAFKKTQPPVNYLELSKKFVSYAKGLPLALEVLGASLCGKGEIIWHEEFEKLKKIPKADIVKVLEKSLDGLDDTVKEVFLDITFFFYEQNVFFIKLILSHCGFYSESALAILQDKALLRVGSFNNISIHDVIREMGYEVVRKESKDVCKRSRVCHPHDAYSLLKNCKGSKEIEGISLNMSEMEEFDLNPNTFTEMHRLRILNFYTSDYNKVFKLSRGLFSLPETLRYINWYFFPAESLSSNFLGENLLRLVLHHSQIKHLWIEDPELVNLMYIDLTNSKCLKTLPSLSKATRIKEIKLRGCESFIGFSHDLQHLDMLYDLNLKGCTNLDKLPKLPSNLWRLDLSNTAIQKLSSDIQLLIKLEILNLRNCKNLSTLPTEVGALESLEVLELGGSGIRELPQSIVNLRKLTSLYLSKCTELVRLPSCTHEFSSLDRIDIRGCESLCSLPVLPPSLKFLRADDCYSLETLSNCGFNGLGDLAKLNLQNCIKLDRKGRSEVMKHCEVMLHSDLQSNLYYHVPGDEIPDWFDYKSCGSSITIESPLSIFTGIACSVVVGPQEYPQDSGQLRFDVEYLDCEVECNHVSFSRVQISSRACRDHVLVWSTFHVNQFHDLILGSDFLFDFTVSPMSRGKEEMGHQLVIKKCGINVIMTEEAFVTIPSSSDDEPTRSTRKRKAENIEEA